MPKPRHPSPDALLTALRTAYPSIAFDWTEAHPAVAVAFLRQFQRLAAHYPAVTQRLRVVSAVKFETHAGKSGYASPDGSQIIVNTAWARDGGNRGEAAWLCRHEFGHQQLNLLASHPATAARFLAWRGRFGAQAGDADHAIIGRWLEKPRVRLPKVLRELFAAL